MDYAIFRTKTKRLKLSTFIKTASIYVENNFEKCLIHFEQFIVVGIFKKFDSYNK